MNTAEELRAHYAAVRQRLTAPRPAPKPVAVERKSRHLGAAHDRHVTDYRVEFMRRMANAAIETPQMRIMKEICFKYRVDAADVRGCCRERWAVVPRHEYFYRMHVEEGWTFSRIGWHFDVDHTTVMNGVKRHRARISGGDKQ